MEKDIDILTLLACDFDKYVNWIMNKMPTSEEQKKASYNSAVKFLMKKSHIENESAAQKKKRQKQAEKKVALKDLSGNPKERFPFWRKHSLKLEMDFKNSRYENSILPLDAIRDKEAARVCERINERYPVQLLDIVEGRLTEDYYDIANLIGKIDYLKSLFSVKVEEHKISNISKSDSFEDYLTKEGIEKLPKLKKIYRNAKPQKIAAGLWAMFDLDLLKQSPENMIIEHLHIALTNTFGDIGSRQQLNTNIPLTNTDPYSKKVDAQKEAIKKGK